MPVTLKVAKHGSNAYEREKVTSAQALFEGTSPVSAQCSKGIIQSSFSDGAFETKHIISSTNGFVKAAFHAYSEHYHLIIRPDDVWFAILSQLSFYINANAEALRGHFVSHQGQKELEVQAVGTIQSVDMGALARDMTALIQESVKDPNLCDWIMPAFSTTTVNDRTTAAVLMMGSMQAYFTYKFGLLCGLPSITLLGDRADYEDILARLDKLLDLGPETSIFADLLRPILRRFIATFDPAQDAASRDFWGRIAHKSDAGSGPSYLGGWLTAFCFWSEKGECLHDSKLSSTSSYRRSWLLELDGVAYDRVEIGEIPAGNASVPVLVDDNGKKYHTKMIAGSLGIECMSSSDSGEVGGNPDSMQSLSGWIMYEVEALPRIES